MPSSSKRPMEEPAKVPKRQKVTHIPDVTLTDKEENYQKKYIYHEATEPVYAAVPKPFGGKGTVSRNLKHCKVLAIHNSTTITHAALLCREPIVVFPLNFKYHTFDASRDECAGIELVKDSENSALGSLNAVLRNTFKRVIKKATDLATFTHGTVECLNWTTVSVGYGTDLPHSETILELVVKEKFPTPQAGSSSQPQSILSDVLYNERAREEIGQAIERILTDHTTSHRRTLNGTSQPVGESLLTLAKVLLQTKFGYPSVKHLTPITAGGKNGRSQTDVIYTGPVYDNVRGTDAADLVYWEEKLLHYAQPYAEKCAEYIALDEEYQKDGGYATLSHNHDFGLQLSTGILMVVGECKSGGKNIDDKEMMKVIIGILRTLNLHNMGIGVIIGQDHIRVLYCIVNDEKASSKVIAATGQPNRQHHPETVRFKRKYKSDRIHEIKFHCVDFRTDDFYDEKDGDEGDLEAFMFADFFMAVIQYLASLIHKFTEMHQGEISLLDRSGGLDPSKDLNDSQSTAQCYGIYNGNNIKFAKRKSPWCSEALLEGHANVQNGIVTVPCYDHKFPTRRFVRKQENDDESTPNPLKM